MSEAHRLRGTRQPNAERLWTQREDDLARTLVAKEVAMRAGRTLQAVWSQGRELQLPNGRTRTAPAEKDGV